MTIASYFSFKNDIYQILIKNKKFWFKIKMVVLFVPENNAISGNPQEVVWKVARNIKRFVLMKKVLFCRKRGVKLKTNLKNFQKQIQVVN